MNEIESNFIPGMQINQILTYSVNHTDIFNNKFFQKINFVIEIIKIPKYPHRLRS